MFNVEEHKVIQDLKYWIWASQAQLLRLNEAFEESAELARDPENFCSLSFQKIHAHSSFEAHFLTIALNQLRKSLKNPLVKDLKKSESEKILNSIKSLRDV